MFNIFKKKPNLKLSDEYIKKATKEIMDKNPNITLDELIKEVYKDDKDIYDAMIKVMEDYNIK